MNSDEYRVSCNMDNNGKWFLNWCDKQRIVFFTPKLLGVHVRVGRIQHHRINFFASIKVLTEFNVYNEVQVVTNVVLEYIKCVL
jgi:hypothetical protein